MGRPLVVASIPIRSARDLELALSIDDADYVELRLDYYEKPEEIDYSAFRSRRVIATLREPCEGGVRGFDPGAKLRLLKLWRDLSIMYDVEISFIERYGGVDYENAIVSLHILGDPPPLERVKKKVLKYIDRAYAVKIATVPFNGYKAYLASLLELGDRVAVMPMAADPATRIAFALLGSRLVYGYVVEATAKGQIHYKKLAEIINSIYCSQ